METTYRVLRIEEQMYGCEELPAGQPVLCDVTLADPAGERRTLPYPDKELTRLGIDEGSTVVLTADGTLKRHKTQEEHMKKIKTSALIGLGALGILFGRKMPGVQVIADEDRIARYSAEPVVCNGEECKFSYVTPAEGRPVDLLLVAVKATVLEQAIQDIAKFIGPDTVILSVLNGITSEEHIDAAYPGHTLWSVAIGMDATRTGRTLVFNQAGKIQFGERSGEMTDRVQAVADYLDECGIANEPCGDILYKQWNKLMVNDGLNQAAAAFDQPYGGLRQPGEAQDMMRAAMQEVIRLANLEGVPLPPDNDVQFIDAMMPTFNPEGMPSMRQDVLAKRPTEVEEFAGVVRQRAKKYGMPTPANDFFYTRIREIEAGYDQ